MGRRRHQQCEFIRMVLTYGDFLEDLKAAFIRPSTRMGLQELGNSIGLEQACDERLVFELVGKCDYPALKEAVKVYRCKLLAERRRIRQTKRVLVSTLHLRGDALSYKDMDIHVVQRSRTYFPNVKMRWHLVDMENESLCSPTQRSFIVNDKDGWYTVRHDESRIFVDDGGEIQLAVLRNVTRMPQLLKSINAVIEDATCDRRNVRPDHSGSMIQYGWNAGPRSCRVWGLVNNFKNVDILSDTEKQEKDRQILGAMALTWHLFRSRAPKEIVNDIEYSINESGMPEMSGRYDEDRHGYTVEYLGHMLNFPYMSRAPCEGYLVTDYAAPTHRDCTYSKYSFSWITEHDDSRVEAGSVGGNYIDITLGVRVFPAIDTLLIFRPEFLHGTTKCNPNIKRKGVVVTFSQRIKDAYEHAVEKAKLGSLCDVKIIDGAI